MKLQAIKIANFKKIAGTTVPVSPLTVLVGGNNSGKSCVLQAAHFAVGLLQSEAEVGTDTFTPDKVRYQPTREFWDLAHEDRLVEGAPPISVAFEFEEAKAGEASKFEYEVKVSRGAGESIVLEVTDLERTTQMFSDSSRPFSIYVPGLAGIPLREEYRVDAILARGIAGGEANLYLRNVLLRIHEKPERRERLNDLLQRIVPNGRLEVNFNPKLHQVIDARIEVNGISRSIEAFGTGVLQYLQIIAYVVNFSPALLLLDEPDSHLHPNNQRMIASALKEIAAGGETSVLLATHSRTILDQLENSEHTNFVWIDDGSVHPEQGKDRISMLVGLGALEGAERFYSTGCATIVLTEDTDTSYLRVLLEANGAKPAQFLIHSYRTSSKFNSAIDLSRFINLVKPGVRVIIHRDRDFMTAEDEARFMAAFPENGKAYSVFLTSYSDVEHYFLNPAHISSCTDLQPQDVEAMINGIAAKFKTTFYDSFRSKRDQIKYSLYNDDRANCQSSLKLFESLPVFESSLGKELLKKVSDALQETCGKNKSDLLVASAELKDARLSQLIADLPAVEGSESAWPREIPKGAIYG